MLPSRPARSLGSTRCVHARSFHFSDFRVVWCLIKPVCFRVRRARWPASQASASLSFHFTVFCFYITEQSCGSCRVCSFTFNSQICFVLSPKYIWMSFWWHRLLTCPPSPPLFIFLFLLTNSVVFILLHNQPVSSLSPLTCLDLHLYSLLTASVWEQINLFETRIRRRNTCLSLLSWSFSLILAFYFTPNSLLACCSVVLVCPCLRTRLHLRSSPVNLNQWCKCICTHHLRSSGRLYSHTELGMFALISSRPLL